MSCDNIENQECVDIQVTNLFVEHKTDHSSCSDTNRQLHQIPEDWDPPFLDKVFHPNRNPGLQ
jgi:hypothetical protein